MKTREEHCSYPVGDCILAGDLIAAERKRCVGIVRGHVERDGDDCVMRSTVNLVIDRIIAAIEDAGAT